MLPLELLPYFVAVAEELHFGAAASRLGMTQPPLSQRIRQLEAALQVSLFTRSTRRVLLTAAGEVLLSRSRALLAAADEAKQATVRAGHGLAGNLRVGFTSSSAYEVLPPALARFTREYPDVALELRERVSVLLVQDLLANRIDVALVRPAADELAPGLEARVVYEESMMLALPRSHPLAALKAVPTRRLDGLPIIGFSGTDSPYFARVVEQLFSSAGIRPSIRRESVLPTIVALVAAGLGAALVPSSAATMHHESVRYRPLTGPGSHVRVSLLCAFRQGTADPTIANFVNSASHAVARVRRR
jgi:DNA-binding transcriptional LysR family regulator